MVVEVESILCDYRDVFLLQSRPDDIVTDRWSVKSWLTQTTWFSTAVTKHDEGLNHRREYRNKLRPYTVLWVIISWSKDWFSQPAPSLTAFSPSFLCEAYTKRRGTYSTLISLFILQVKVFSLRPLSSTLAVVPGNSKPYPTMSFKSSRVETQPLVLSLHHLIPSHWVANGVWFN